MSPQHREWTHTVACICGWRLVLRPTGKNHSLRWRLISGSDWRKEICSSRSIQLAAAKWEGSKSLCMGYWWKNRKDILNLNNFSRSLFRRKGELQQPLCSMKQKSNLPRSSGLPASFACRSPPCCALRQPLTSNVEAVENPFSAEFRTKNGAVWSRHFFSVLICLLPIESMFCQSRQDCHYFNQVLN